MGMPPPPKARLLEPVTVQPKTLAAMVGAAKAETDLKAEHWSLLALGEKYYGGKLASYVSLVQDLAEAIESRFGRTIHGDAVRLREAVEDR